jgi:hypothetical protein
MYCRRSAIAEKETAYMRAWLEAIDAERGWAEGGWLREAARQALGPGLRPGDGNGEGWRLLSERVWARLLPRAGPALLAAVSDDYGVPWPGADEHARRLSAEMLGRLLPRAPPQ